MKVVGYARLSRAGDGHGLQVQREAIEAHCRRQGWDLIGIEEDEAASGRSMRKRPALARAIEACTSKRAQAIVSSRVDRMARSSLDFARLIETAQKFGFDLVCVEQGFSLKTPEGKLLASILASFAAFEIDLVSARTKDALAVVKAQGSRSGKPIGNPGFRGCPSDVRDRILRLRAKGLRFSEIARRLNAEQVPTAQGGKWFGSTVSKILRREALAV